MYDVIGDVHGMSDALKRLLSAMGYINQNSVYAHPEGRQAIFVGDLIDRGPNGIEVVEIAKAMTLSGNAITVMGNHELNAIFFNEVDSDGKPYRVHSDKNIGQHKSFLDQLSKRHDGDEKRKEIIDWFKSLPLYYENDDFRVVHACWDTSSKLYLDSILDDQNRLPESIFKEASTQGHEAYRVIEKWLKGDEQTLPNGLSYLDKSGDERTEARLQWWKPEGTQLDELALLQGDKIIQAQIRETLKGHVPKKRVIYNEQKAVFIGHYWMNGTPQVQAEYVCCVDYSAGKGDKLCAHRWNGESGLNSDGFVCVSV